MHHDHMLPVVLPITPMLAKSADSVPVGAFAYEPKWDGFRCIVVRDGGATSLQSRSKKPLDRYFPEIVDAVGSLPPDCVLDGEIVVRAGVPGAQRLSWEDLSNRIHPAASRIDRLTAETPAELVFFDLLGIGEHPLLGLPYRERRTLLEQLFEQGDLDDRLHLSAMTTDPAVARDWFVRFEGAGLDGVIAKPLAAPYEPGKRTMWKIKHKRTAEAVVIGYRPQTDGPGVGSLMLGMYDDEGQLLKVGGIGSLTDKARDDLAGALDPLIVRDETGNAVKLDFPRSRYGQRRADVPFIPLLPELVVEVAFDQLEGQRFRYAATFLRWRPDRDPESCLISQVDRAIGYDLDEVFAT